MQRLRDQLLADVRAVGVGGVDEVDAELDRAPQHGERSSRSGGSPQIPSPVMRIAPNPSRFTVMSAMSNVPAAVASAMAAIVPEALA